MNVHSLFIAESNSSTLCLLQSIGFENHSSCTTRPTAEYWWLSSNCRPHEIQTRQGIDTNISFLTFIQNIFELDLLLVTYMMFIIKFCQFKCVAALSSPKLLETLFWRQRWLARQCKGLLTDNKEILIPNLIFPSTSIHYSLRYLLYVHFTLYSKPSDIYTTNIFCFCMYITW